jgi:hypothetical protein
MRPRSVALSTFLLLLLAGVEGITAGMRFVDATESSGIVFAPVCGARPGEKGWLTEGMGSGGAWLDYDGDGNLDLYLINGSTHDRQAGRGEPNRLYRGDGKGHFTDVTDKTGVGDRGWGYGVTVGDYDNDGDPDLFIANLGANALYRNNGNGSFTDVTQQAGVGPSPWSTSAAFVDIDRDGDLDLYVANYMESDITKIPRSTDEAAVQGSCSYQGIQVFCGPKGRRPEQDQLFRNNGDGTFTDITRTSGISLPTPRFALGVVSADYDNDGDPDLYVANDSVINSLWRNNGDGTFSDVGIASLTGLNVDGRAQAGMGTDFGDYNGDGWLDLVVTNFAHDLNTVYRNLSGRFFVDESSLVGMGVTNLALSWGTGFHDFDQDGDLDLLIANGHVYSEVDDYDLGTSFRQTNHLFENQAGRFKDVSTNSGPGLRIARSFRGAAFADYDNDGDIDVLLTALDEAPILLRNDSPSAGNRLQLVLTGTRSNRDGVGARVTVTTGSATLIRERKGGGSYLSASDPRIHVGLGAATRADRVEIRWPSGTIDVLKDIPANRVITVREGSSPASGSEKE